MSVDVNLIGDTYWISCLLTKMVHKLGTAYEINIVGSAVSYKTLFAGVKSIFF